MELRFSRCPGDDELAGFLARCVEPAACRAIESHLDSCGRCREVIGHLAATRDGICACAGPGWIE